MAVQSEDGEVLGLVVNVCIDGVMSVFQRRMRNMLDEQGIERPDPHPDQWYPYEKFHRVLSVVEENTGENALRKIGESTPRFADWPSNPDEPVEALQYLTDLYGDTHRNVRGSYALEEHGERVQITSTTPYPTGWESGFIKGTAEQFGASYAQVETVEGGSGQKVFGVEW